MGTSVISCTAASVSPCAAFGLLHNHHAVLGSGGQGWVTGRVGAGVASCQSMDISSSAEHITYGTSSYVQHALAGRGLAQPPTCS